MITRIFVENNYERFIRYLPLQETAWNYSNRRFTIGNISFIVASIEMNFIFTPFKLTITYRIIKHVVKWKKWNLGYCIQKETLKDIFEYLRRAIKKTNDNLECWFGLRVTILSQKKSPLNVVGCIKMSVLWFRRESRAFSKEVRTVILNALVSLCGYGGIISFESHVFLAWNFINRQ